jgi:hypothetical protein
VTERRGGNVRERGGNIRKKREERKCEGRAIFLFCGSATFRFLFLCKLRGINGATQESEGNILYGRREGKQYYRGETLEAEVEESVF